MIKGVIFDLYDTLIYLDHHVFDNHRAKFACKIDKPLDKIEQIWKDYRPQRFTGQIPTLTDMIRIILKTLDISEENVDLKELENLEICALIESVHSYPGVNSMLDSLKSKGYILALLSNTSESSIHVVNRLSWLNRFDEVVLSHETGMMKPDPEIFRYTLEKMGVAASSAIFIGDGGFRELEGAKQAGITTVKVVQELQSRHYERIGDYDFLMESVINTPEFLEKLEATVKE